MTLRPSLAPILLWGLAVVLVAGIVHVSSVLMVPRLAPDDAFVRITEGRPLAEVDALPLASTVENKVPFRDTALRSAICRYDLSKGPLRVTAGVTDGTFSAVSLHSRYGRAFYALTDSSAVEGKIEILLATATQLAKIAAQDSEDEPVHDIRVTAPGDEGFVELDVLPRLGGVAGASASLSMSCKIERNV